MNNPRTTRPRGGRTYRSAAAVAAAAACLGLAGVAQARVVHGTVVHHNGRAHSFAVADTRGDLFAIHARQSPGIGRRVAVTVSGLRNGTFSERQVRVAGRNRHVRLRGMVSFASRRHGFFVLSGDGVSMIVRPSRGHSDQMPPVGSEVTATGEVDDQGDLDEQSVQDNGGAPHTIDVEGTILSIDNSARTITVSADDDEQSGSSVVVSVPTSFDLSKFTVGQEVELSVVPQGSGFVLQGSSSDEGTQGADSQGQEQGDQSQGDDHEDGGQSGQSGTGGTGGDDGSGTSGSAGGSAGGGDGSGD